MLNYFRSQIYIAIETQAEESSKCTHYYDVCSVGFNFRLYIY